MPDDLTTLTLVMRPADFRRKIEIRPRRSISLTCAKSLVNPLPFPQNALKRSICFPDGLQRVFMKVKGALLCENPRLHS